MWKVSIIFFYYYVKFFVNEVLDLNTNISKSLSIKGVASAPALLYACVAGRQAAGLAGLGWAGLGWAGLGWAGLGSRLRGWAGIGWAGFEAAVLLARLGGAGRVWDWLADMCQIYASGS